ncbi:transcription factor of the MADS box [Kickxella alabastrina]|uniref:Transcription factor of the MADS box n=1 Tax=Kickxella alabastrina TaxID=61397 RepID=A0ACC1IQT1_9FUNG|nr:transcription factor of the MADS box [Kickxella alabastrina]
MNSAFIPEDLSRPGSGYVPLDATNAGNPLLDHHQHAHVQGHHSHLQQSAARFSSGTESRTQTPAAKRSRDDIGSDGEDSESNSRSTAVNAVEKRAGRRKIKIEYIEDKSRRHITFSKRKAGIMKKAYELSTLTGTQIMLLVVSETGLVYTFTTPKLQPMVTQPEGKNLIQACLSVPDMPGERVSQPIPTESNSYMSQPRQSQSHSSMYANSAAAAAVAAVAASNAAALMGGGNVGAGHDLHQSLGEDRKVNDGSPATAGNPNSASYLPYQYNQNAVAQVAAAVAVASGGTPNSYASNMVSQNPNGNMHYAAVPGYTSYPGSTSQSQHHSPTASANTHTSQPAGGNNGISAAVAAAASSIPGMNSLSSYHHGYSHQQAQQHHQQNHYTYSHHPQHQQHYQQQQHQYHGHQQQQQHQSQASTPGTPLESTSTASAVAAAVAAASSQSQGAGGIGGPMQAPGSIPASYMAANHYWSQSALASPHQQQQQQQAQAQPQQQSASGLVQRTGYAGGN